MTGYHRLFLGPGSQYLAQCVSEGFVGLDYDESRDLTGAFPDSWRAFNLGFIPVYIAEHPGTSRVRAGVVGGTFWTLGKGMEEGHTLLCPDGAGGYRVCRVAGVYHFVPQGPLPHRRSVVWSDTRLSGDQFSPALLAACKSPAALCSLEPYAEELQQLLGGSPAPVAAPVDLVASRVAFELERQLEDFIVANWRSTEFGERYDIYSDGDITGQQLQTDTGPLDILAASKDGSEYLVIELKRGRPGDAVVGQILRYMAFVKDQVAEPHQEVSGVIIGLESDPRLSRSLSMLPSVRFMRYEVEFRLVED